MQKIKYEFSDGTTSEIEVTDEVYALHLQLVQEEKRNHWRETRRHTSLNHLMELGVDFTDTAADPFAADPFAAVELRENDERIQKAISKLLPEQQARERYVVFQRERAPETGTEREGGTQGMKLHPALFQRLQSTHSFFISSLTLSCTHTPHLCRRFRSHTCTLPARRAFGMFRCVRRGTGIQSFAFQPKGSSKSIGFPRRKCLGGSSATENTNPLCLSPPLHLFAQLWQS